MAEVEAVDLDKWLLAFQYRYPYDLEKLDLIFIQSTKQTYLSYFTFFLLYSTTILTIVYYDTSQGK